VPACAPQQADDRSAATPAAEYRAFGAPQRVTIRGYDGDAMEPFITKDGLYLLFNNRNDPRTNTNLHFAARVDGLTFQYRGEIKGVNTPVLEGVPSLDRGAICSSCPCAATRRRSRRSTAAASTTAP